MFSPTLRRSRAGRTARPNNCDDRSPPGDALPETRARQAWGPRCRACAHSRGTRGAGANHSALRVWAVPGRPRGPQTSGAGGCRTSGLGHWLRPPGRRRLRGPGGASSGALGCRAVQWEVPPSRGTLAFSSSAPGRELRAGRAPASSSRAVPLSRLSSWAQRPTFLGQLIPRAPQSASPALTCPEFDRATHGVARPRPLVLRLSRGP